MNSVTLLQSTNSPSVDAMLEGAIRAFEMVFPDRVRGYYLMGSYTDGTALPTSDIDGFILFKDNFLDGKEKERAWALCHSCDLMMAPEFDFTPVGESVFNQHGDVSLKLDSLLLYGEDIREQIPFPDIEFYTRMLMHTTLRFFTRIRENAAILSYPISYPNSNEEYYGYVQEVKDDPNRAATKELINCVGKPALALVTNKTREFVKNKVDCLNQYKTHIHDEWTTLIEDIYNKCRKEWEYCIPTNIEDQAVLKTLCQSTLLFENHFLSSYKDFLIEELNHPYKASLWLSMNEIENWLGVSEEFIKSQAASDQSQTQIAKDGELRILIDDFYSVVAIKGFSTVKFPDVDVKQKLKEFEYSTNVWIKHLWEKSLQQT